jgi:3-hydroxy-3-methylglutaryl CoA synthase
LEQAAPGQKIVLGSYGSGCDTALLETTERMGSLKDRRGIRKQGVSADRHRLTLMKRVCPYRLLWMTILWSSR